MTLKVSIEFLLWLGGYIWSKSNPENSFLKKEKQPGKFWSLFTGISTLFYRENISISKCTYKNLGNNFSRFWKIDKLGNWF